MITSTPVGDWTWELGTDDGEIRPTRAAQTAAAIWTKLADQELAVPEGKAAVRVVSRNNVRDVHVDVQGLPTGQAPLAPGSAFAQAVARSEEIVGDLVVTIRIECPGLWLDNGTKYRSEKLFAIHAEVWGGSLFVVTLETYSDVWLTMDTRDREQPEVCAANAPRLAAALLAISTLLGSAPAPGDENRYAAPNTTGFKDLRSEGSAYDDSWGTFERLDRASLLASRIPRSDDEYEQVTEYPVQYFTVRKGETTLGFLWASVDNAAAGYVPRTAAGDDAFDAGAEWLLSLRKAHRQGLAPLAALHELARDRARPEIGVVAEESSLEAPSLDALEELSGRY